MSDYVDNKQNGNLPLDPLEGLSAPSAAEKQKKSPKPKKPKKDDGGKQIVRIGKLEKKLVKNHEGEDIDPDTVVSMYMPRRRARAIGLLLLRLDRLSLLLLAALTLIVILFIAAFMQEKMGNFTINLNRLELYRKGIAISADRNFSDPTARLSAEMVDNATNTTWDYLPDDLDEIDGDHNGRDYVAYTYYVRNAGKVDVGYVAQLVLDGASKGAEYATRVAVWRNGEMVTYAEPAANGQPEPGTVPFESHTVVCTYHVPDFLVGYVDKYTVVIWLEGEDPECVDAIVGGNIQFSMNIDADDTEKTSLVSKFIRDVTESVTDQQPIEAAGVEAPDYYKRNGVTWDERRNK